MSMKANRYIHLLLCFCLYTCIGTESIAQGVCASSALAPVYSQNFGTSTRSTDKSGAPAGFITNYAFSNSLNDGQFMVTPRVENAGKGDWAVGADHTTDAAGANGNMFLVNAGRPSSGPVDLFFKQQVDNLCPGSVYSFSAWLVNVNTQSNTAQNSICGPGVILPKVTFFIKSTTGTILQQYTTIDLPLTTNRTVAPNWQQYGFQFTLPSGITSVVLEMRDALGGQASYCGNDLAIDDILFSACTPTATAVISTASTICSGSSTSINCSLVNSPFSNPAYQWQKSTDGGTNWTNIGTPGTSAASYTINSAVVTDGATYRVIVGPDVASLTSSTCVTASNAVALTVNGVRLAPDVIECNNGVTVYAPTGNFGVTYSNTNAGSTYAWTVVSPGIFEFKNNTTPSSQYPRMQFLTGYAYEVIAMVTTNGISCKDTQMVYKDITPAVAIQTQSDTTVCFNSGPISLRATASPVTNSLIWTTTGSGTFSNPNSLNTTYTLSTADKNGGTFTLSLAGTSTLNFNGNCSNTTATASVTLNVYPNNAGTNTTQTVCSNQVLNYTPVATVPGSAFSWVSTVTSGSMTGNTASGTGKIIDSLINLTGTTDAVVRYTITPYAFTPTNQTCPGTPFTYTVTARPRPTIAITNAPAAICTGTATNIQFNSSIAGSNYTWTSSILSGTMTGNTSNAVPSTTNQISNVLVNNTTSNLTVRYLITAIPPTGCSRTDTTDVLVYGLPTTANAGPDQALCNVTNTILAGNNPVLGTGVWTAEAGNPSTVTFVSPSSANSAVNGLVAGTYQFRWTISNGSCVASYDIVQIVNAPQTVGGAVSADATVCAGANGGTLTLTGHTGVVIRWESSTDGGSTWPNIINNTTTSYTYGNLTTTTFFRAVVQSGTCNPPANSGTAAITVNPATVAGIISSDATVCSASNSGILNLTGTIGDILRWESSTDGGGSWTPIVNITNITPI
jgi:hypothetical protein